MAVNCYFAMLGYVFFNQTTFSVFSSPWLDLAAATSNTSNYAKPKIQFPRFQMIKCQVFQLKENMENSIRLVVTILVWLTNFSRLIA